MKFTGYHRLYLFIYNILCYTNFRMTEINIQNGYRRKRSDKKYVHEKELEI